MTWSNQKYYDEEHEKPTPVSNERDGSEQSYGSKACIEMLFF